jgi:branched-chain amino acid aminotransferase
VSGNKRLVYMNGEFVSEAEARISIYDSALMFGDMVFEMTRSFNKVQFKLREHIERLYASMRMVQIAPPMTMDEMENAALRTVEANEPCFAPDDEHRLMIDVTRGLLGIYDGRVDIPTGTNVIIADFPLRWTVATMGPLFDTGINAVVPSQRAIPATLLDPKIKSRSRLHYMMANIQVAQVVGDNNWALLLDPDGYVAEGTGDNFFIVTKDAIVTPEPHNILRGISREYVFELAHLLGVACLEREIEVYDVVNAQEAFMTGTPFCVLPVTGINGQPIGDGRPGTTTRRVLDAWSAKVGVDIVAQIKAWSASTTTAGEGPSPYAFKRRR